MDEWFQELREMGDAVRARPEALMRVHRQLTRRRRQRAIGGAAGAAAMVGLVAVAIGVLPDRLGSDKAPADVTSSPSPSADLFDCPRQSRVFGEAPAIPDRGRQQEIVETAHQHASTQFDVRRAEPTHLGVVALVSGDLAAARQLLPEVGVRHVYKWDPSGASVGLTARAQIQQALQWLLEPAIADVRASSRGIAGNGGLALWQEAGAVLLQWKRPVPPEIQQLEGTRPDGVRVIVDPVRFSAAETGKAGRKLFKAGTRLDAFVTTTTGCADGSGVIAGVDPESLGDRRAELEEKMAEIVGMPVRVVPQAAPIPLGGSVERPVLVGPSRERD